MGSLYSTAMRFTKNRPDAEDLVSETVAKAWHSFSTLEDRKRFRPWIFCIMRNCFISSYRKSSEETVYEENPAEDSKQEIAALLVQQSNDFMNWWANPEKEFFNDLLCDDIMKAIESLPESFQSTILLVNLEGFTYDEAAEILGVSSGTIRSRMNRGRTLLQRALWQHAKDAGLARKETLIECET